MYSFVLLLWCVQDDFHLSLLLTGIQLSEEPFCAFIGGIAMMFIG